MEGETIRAGDADREQALHLIRDACVRGQLTLGEFSQRTEAALSARTVAELAPLSRDLAPAPALAPPQEAGRSKPRRWINILGSIQLGGAWRPAAENTMVNVLGSSEVDLNQAKLPGPELTITQVNILGSVEVTVPDGCHVEVEGLTIMGSKEYLPAKNDPLPGAPTIRIRAFTLLGSLRVSA